MKIMIEVRRPGGEIETVDVTAKTHGVMSDVIFAEIKAATSAASRGEALRWWIEDTRTDAEIAHAEVDRAEEDVDYAAKKIWYENHRTAQNQSGPQQRRHN